MFANPPMTDAGCHCERFESRGGVASPGAKREPRPSRAASGSQPIPAYTPVLAAGISFTWPTCMRLGPRPLSAIACCARLRSGRSAGRKTQAVQIQLDCFRPARNWLFAEQRRE